MEGEEAGGFRLGKKSTADKEGEVDYKTKSGTAWSHSFLNQKPWHPLSYPNQRRKWIAEQTNAQKQRRAEEVSREYAQEQEFLRQTALISKKEKERLEMMKAVSFMYVKPPGYNAESAKAAEADDEKKKQKTELSLDKGELCITNRMENVVPAAQEKKKSRPKDIYGRAIPTEEQFEVLKNAPRLETGVLVRAKPFGIEIRNVKCLRCGTFGHQSGDRECPLKDAIMPNEEIRLKRDDPLTSIIAQTESNEPVKWELKQKPGMSPPRGGFNPDDANQQIVAEDIFDEYGGFLDEANIPELLTNFSSRKAKKKISSGRHKRRSQERSNMNDYSGKSSSVDERVDLKKKRHGRKKGKHVKSSSSERLETNSHRKRSSSHRYDHSSSDCDEPRRTKHHHEHRHRHRYRIHRSRS